MDIVVQHIILLFPLVLRNEDLRLQGSGSTVKSILVILYCIFFISRLQSAHPRLETIACFSKPFDIPIY